MAELDSLLRDLGMILTQEGIPPEELRDRVVIPLLNRLGHPDNLIIDHPGGESGSDLLVQDRAGAPLISVGCRHRSSTGLTPFRPYLHNSLMRQARTPIGLLADGLNLEVWELRGKTPLRLTAWPPEEARARQTVLREIALLEEPVLHRLRVTEPPQVIEPADPDTRVALGRHMLLVQSLVRFDLKTRFAGAMQAVLERGSTPARHEEIATRIKDGYRRWATAAEHGFLPYMAMTARVAALRIVTSLVLEARERREGAPAFPDGRGGAAIRSAERLRRLDSSLYGGGPFDWYLPEDGTHDAARRLLAPYRIASLEPLEVRSLARGEDASGSPIWAKALSRVLPEGAAEGLWVAGTTAALGPVVMASAGGGDGRLAGAWHLRSLGRTAQVEARLDLTLLNAAPPSSTGLVGDPTPECDWVVIEATAPDGESWAHVPVGRRATVVLLDDREPPRTLLERFAALSGGAFLFDLGAVADAPPEARLLLRRADDVVPQDADGQAAVHIVRGVVDLDELGPRPFKAIAAPLERVLWGKGGRPDFEFDPVVESVVKRVSSSATLLGKMADWMPGHSDEEVVISPNPPRDPLALRAIGPGRELGRFWIRWSDKWWVPPDSSAAEGGRIPGAVLVRWERGRLFAAWDESGLIPVAGVLRIVPRLPAGEDPRVLVALLNSSWARAYLQRAEAHPEVDLARALQALPVRMPPRAELDGWTLALNGIDRSNQLIQKNLDRLASIDKLAQEAWVRRVPLRDATGTLLSHRVPPVLGSSGPVVCEGSEVRIGEELVLRARTTEVARLLHRLLETEVPKLVGHSGVEIEKMFQIPRTESEATLLLTVLDRLRGEIDDAVQRRADWEVELESRSLELYRLTAEDVRILAGPPPAADAPA